MGEFMSAEEPLNYKDLETKVEVGDVESAYQLGELIYADEDNWTEPEADHGPQLKPEILSQIAKLFRQAAEGGHVEAMSSLAWMLTLEYMNKDDEPKAVSEYVYYSEESFSWLLRAAELGHVNSQGKVGLVISWPNNPHYDLSESLKWFAKAALQGDFSVLNDTMPEVISSIREQAERQHELSNKEGE